MAGSAVAVYVGIDVSKAQLEVAIRPSGERFSEANDARAVRRLVKRLAPLGCTRIVVEATGGYEALLAAAPEAPGVPYRAAIARAVAVSGPGCGTKIASR